MLTTEKIDVAYEAFISTHEPGGEKARLIAALSVIAPAYEAKIARLQKQVEAAKVMRLSINDYIQAGMAVSQGILTVKGASPTVDKLAEQTDAFDAAMEE